VQDRNDGFADIKRLYVAEAKMAVGFEFATAWQILRLKDNASIGDIRSAAEPAELHGIVSKGGCDSQRNGLGHDG